MSGTPGVNGVLLELTGVSCSRTSQQKKDSSKAKQARDVKDTPTFPYNPVLQKILIGVHGDASVRHLDRHPGFLKILFSLAKF